MARQLLAQARQFGIDVVVPRWAASPALGDRHRRRSPTAAPTPHRGAPAAGGARPAWAASSSPPSPMRPNSRPTKCGPPNGFRSTPAAAGRRSSRAGSSTTASPARRPLAMLTMSPRRNDGQRIVDGPAGAAAATPATAPSPVRRSPRAAARSRESGASRPPISAAISSSIRSPRSMARTRPTTERSAWYCAKDRSSSLCACVGPIWFTRLIVMLYDGANELRSGKVRVDARPATSAGSTSGRPQHHRVAFDVDAAPARTAGQLGVLPRRQLDVLLAVELHQPLEDDRAGGHVDAQSQCLRGEYSLDQALGEQLLHGVAEHRQHSGVVCGQAAQQPLPPFVVAEHDQVGVGQVGAPAVDDLGDAGALVVGGQPQRRAQALFDRGVAADAGEDERDGGQQPFVVQHLDDVGPRRRSVDARAAAMAAAAARIASRRAGRLRVDVRCAATVVGPPAARGRSSWCRRTGSRRGRTAACRP